MTYDLQDFKSSYDWREGFLTVGADVNDVIDVIAADEGYNDGDDWLCVCLMANGKYGVVRAWCDYTGWDCQSGGRYEEYGTLEEAISKVTLTPGEQERLCGDIQSRGIEVDWNE